MPTHIRQPTRVPAEGTKPKQIDEYVGRVNSGTESVSVARMDSPAGWVEPGQTPEFDEFTLVLDGELEVESRDGRLTVSAGEAVITHAGEWVRFGTPNGARYVAVCVPAFAPDLAHRDTD